MSIGPSGSNTTNGAKKSAMRNSSRFQNDMGSSFRSGVDKKHQTVSFVEDERQTDASGVVRVADVSVVRVDDDDGPSEP